MRRQLEHLEYEMNRKKIANSECQCLCKDRLKQCLLRQKDQIRFFFLFEFIFPLSFQQLKIAQMENWLMMVTAMTKTTMKSVSLTGMIVAEVVSILIFAHSVPALVILQAMGIQILRQVMAFAMMKQTPLNALTMVWIAADPMLLLITALIVLVMVSTVRAPL